MVDEVLKDVEKNKNILVLVIDEGVSDEELNIFNIYLSQKYKSKIKKIHQKLVSEDRLIERTRKEGKFFGDKITAKAKIKSNVKRKRSEISSLIGDEYNSLSPKAKSRLKMVKKDYGFVKVVFPNETVIFFTFNDKCDGIRFFRRRVSGKDAMFFSEAVFNHLLKYKAIKEVYTKGFFHKYEFVANFYLNQNQYLPIKHREESLLKFSLQKFSEGMGYLISDSDREKIRKNQVSEMRFQLKVGNQDLKDAEIKRLKDYSIK
jgi:hypothetical protein